MIWFPFKKYAKGFLGIDIGTFSIKIVELSRQGRIKKLENYGEIKTKSLYQEPFKTFERNILTLSSRDIARAILAIIKEAKIKNRKSSFSIPDFSSFFTTLELPPMTEEELPRAVEYEARQHIPLPLSEVILDWQIIEKEDLVGGTSIFKVLLVVVPNEVIHQYQEISRNAQLELQAIEAEVFGLSRALIKTDNRSGVEKKEKSPIALTDIGARSTTISIIEEGVLQLSHSFDIAGRDLTEAIAKELNLDNQQAEELKKKYGLRQSISFSQEGKKGLGEIQLPFIDLILNEIEKIFQNFYRKKNKKIQKIILAGGSALLPGLVDYFSKKTEKPTEIANPFSEIYYPPILEETLKEMGPSYAVAVGEALRGLETL